MRVAQTTTLVDAVHSGKGPGRNFVDPLLQVSNISIPQVHIVLSSDIDDDICKCKIVSKYFLVGEHCEDCDYAVTLTDNMNEGGLRI